VAGSIVHTTASSRSACIAALQRVRIRAARARPRACPNQSGTAAQPLTCTPTSIPCCQVVHYCCCVAALTVWRPWAGRRLAASLPVQSGAHLGTLRIGPAPAPRPPSTPPRSSRRAATLRVMMLHTNKRRSAALCPRPRQNSEGSRSPGPLRAPDLRVRHAVVPGEQHGVAWPCPGVGRTLDDFKLQSERAPARPAMHILQNRTATASYAHSRQAFPAPSTLNGGRGAPRLRSPLRKRQHTYLLTSASRRLAACHAARTPDRAPRPALQARGCAAPAPRRARLRPAPLPDGPLSLHPTPRPASLRPEGPRWTLHHDQLRRYLHRWWIQGQQRR
jgi:hypothetical protein